MNASQSPSPQSDAQRASAPRLYTWISETGKVIEQVRVVNTEDGAHARGSIVSAAHTDHDAFTLQYEAEIDSDKALQRARLAVSTEAYERTIDLVRGDDGAWQLTESDGSSSRVGGDGVLDVDITFSVYFASVIIRRLGLHRQQDSAEQRTLSVDSITLEVTDDSITMSSDDEQVHGITATASTSATVDSDGMIIDIPGLSRRV